MWVPAECAGGRASRGGVLRGKERGEQTLPKTSQDFPRQGEQLLETGSRASSLKSAEQQELGRKPQRATAVPRAALRANHHAGFPV